MRKTVYLETTIPSYLGALPSRDVILAGRQAVTHDWWLRRRPKFSVFVSPYVVDEATQGDPNAVRRRAVYIDGLQVLAVDIEVTKLAEAFLRRKAIPRRAATDASHIAVALRHNMDYLLTWNCTHIANAEMLEKISEVISRAGYRVPIICTPDQLMGGGLRD